MLPGEIEPYADHHIEVLEEIRKEILEFVHLNPEFTGARVEKLQSWDIKLKNAQSALIRFKICMVDEVKQKNRYRKKFLESPLDR